MENTEKVLSLLSLQQKRFFDPSNSNLTEEERISKSQEEELFIVNKLKNNIKGLSHKYFNMTRYICGGTHDDIEQELTVIAIEVFHEWKSKCVLNGSLKEKNGLDAVKYCSWRLSKRIIDYAREQKAKIEPFQHNAIQVEEAFNVAGKDHFDFHRDFDLSLTPIQKKILNVWLESQKDQEESQKRELSDYAKIIAPLIKRTKEKYPNITEVEIAEALRSFPHLF